MKPETVTGKIILSGELTLDAPLLIGSGSGGSDEQDIHVLRRQGRQGRKGDPILPGSSLAGALRSFLMADNALAGELLFGTETTGKPGGGLPEMQSSLSLSDIVLKNARIITRDGVAIDEITHTAIPQAKYNYEAIDSGASGIFYAELTLRTIHEEHQDLLSREISRLQDYLLSGFPLGAHTAKGFGRVHLKRLVIDTYDFHNPEDVRQWLNLPDIAADQDNLGHGIPGSRKIKTHAPAKPLYAPNDFVITVHCALNSSLIVRSYDKHACHTAEEKWKIAANNNDPSSDESGNTSLTAVMQQDQQGHYLLPGTSLKGALRHHVWHLLRVLGKDTQLTDSLMGPSPAAMREPGAKKMKSRFFVEEAVLKPETVQPYPQTRNRIDRFTGGTIGTALFSTLPIWQQEKGMPSLTLTFGIHSPEKWQIGLTLLLLKELWLGRLPLGGEKSIGRGTLSGETAAIIYQDKTIRLDKDRPLDENTAQSLQAYVTTLLDYEPEKTQEESK
jgi:CRISPR/Cas system CSM-associated protein Csm3 (group 7 of RAMP superfamily)